MFSRQVGCGDGLGAGDPVGGEGGGDWRPVGVGTGVLPGALGPAGRGVSLGRARTLGRTGTTVALALAPGVGLGVAAAVGAGGGARWMLVVSMSRMAAGTPAGVGRVEATAPASTTAAVIARGRHARCSVCRRASRLGAPRS
jgi:hypothetical protein